MSIRWAILGFLIWHINGCNRIKIENIPCPPKNGMFCGEQEKRWIDDEWKLNGWTVNKSGSDGARFSAYRNGELVYSEGQPSHAKWFAQAKTKDFKITVVEGERAQKEIMITDESNKVLYQLEFDGDNLQYIFRVPHKMDQKSDTLFEFKQ